MKIDLPKGSRAQVPGLPPAEITLAVDKDGQYFVNGKPVADVAELPRMVDAVRSQGRKCMIVIRGDKDVVYGKILPALDQVSQLPDVTITLAYAAPEAK
jgi:biopolymer transport protein ExbD